MQSLTDSPTFIGTPVHSVDEIKQIEARIKAEQFVQKLTKGYVCMQCNQIKLQRLVVKDKVFCSSKCFKAWRKKHG